MVKGVLKSQEELKTEGGDFKLLPEDEFIARIAAIEILPDQVSPYQTEPHEEWKVAFTLLSFSNQEPIYYEDNSEPDPTRDVRLTAFVNPTKQGFSNAGTASKARQFICAAYGVPVSQKPAYDTEEMVGKTLIVRNVHKPGRDGEPRDRIDGFRPLRQRPAASKASTSDVEAAAEASLARATDTFGDELKF